ncbi:MAG: thiamine pyrophosphate-dependent dehydrogenase E1 component subunit alpha [Deltaproteobacteria bacterium]|nr:MAG: thiamine pyrophosphate-dependent dehydrogenase E1 component subunit alpha [Deltaproteobacteria bacterium]
MGDTGFLPIAKKRAKQLGKADLLQIHRLMVEGRVLEETMIALYRRGDGFFWIGGPGEEAFNVALGLQIKKGFGPDYDYMHFHYRQSATLLALGAKSKDALRQMRCTALDPYSKGRNFSNHYAIKAWNVCPVSSTIETQYAQAPGTAWVQRRHGGDGITIVTGGDAGAAEGDFATCLIWSSRPGQELPILIIVTNNEYGISTPRETQWAMRDIARRAEPFGIPWASIDGNDVFESWEALRKAMAYVRKERRPYCLQANVSRLHGHSSASGAKRVDDERDCIAEFEEVLVAKKVASRKALDAVWEETRQRLTQEADEVRQEPLPAPESIYEDIYAEAG